MTKDDLAKVIASIAEKSGPTSCWEWPLSRHPLGYGQVYVSGLSQRAHRAAWELLVETIPTGMYICHRCDNPPCINPSHLYVGTQVENMRDMRERGRTTAARYPEVARENGRIVGTKNTHARGASNPGAKLSPQQVDEIRRDNRRTKELVSAYGVNRSTVQRIRNGSLWPTMVKP